tara:strand:- start:3099 stop:3392 length:294 start_codon:yes stop_codon:yes gene_type:complete
MITKRLRKALTELDSNIDRDNGDSFLFLSSKNGYYQAKANCDEESLAGLFLELTTTSSQDDAVIRAMATALVAGGNFEVVKNMQEIKNKFIDRNIKI